MSKQQSEITNCQNCKNDFTIESEDFAFYEKMGVPAPTFCPECRLMRRCVWRNERNLYKRKCLTKDGEKEMISNYGPDVPFPIYELEYWFSDAWDARDYAQEYDSNQPFFAQLKKLMAQVPLPHTTNVQNVDSNFCNFTYQCKNCYLVFASDMNEDSAYLHQSMKNKNSCDLEGCEGMDSCFECYKSRNCYQSSYQYFSHNCIDSQLMWGCYNCHDCFGCVNLRNKSYCIFNEQYTKEEYAIKIQEYKNGSFNTLQNNIKRFLKFRLQFPHKYADIVQSENVTGNHIHNAKNCYNCFDIGNKVEDCSFVSYAFGNTTQCMDVYAGGVNYEQAYETTASGENAQRLLMCGMVWTSSDVLYSLFCNRCTNCFGCVGLRNQSYCIFNKQYTKEEYEELMSKIKQHMNEMPYIDQRGLEYRYGEYFPMELSPFAYNETVAMDYMPKVKQEAQDMGLKWKEKEKNIYTVTLKTEDIPDNIADVSDDILQQVIECKDAISVHSPGAFKLIPLELTLYRKLHLPIPRKSSNARYYERLSMRSPYKLWSRQCMHDGCSHMFQTAYAPDRPEIVYCESCYQSEVL
ncbi:MAG: hypothetical protein KBC22_02295 [Candidatus Pacebacteria bacterium]|nr:hypothetical protein [Candidatus Paceibacterota bacterium]